MIRHSILAASLALSTGALALADDPVSRTVRFNLDTLGTDEDRRDLEADIRRAARRICHEPGVRGVRALRERRHCETEAVSSAMRRVDRRLAQLRNDDTDRTTSVD